MIREHIATRYNPILVMTPPIRYGALVALVVATGLLVWFVAGGQHEDTPPDTVRDYTVSSREEVPDLGTVGEVLVLSVTRSDTGREELFRQIADTEGFAVAFYFSTREAVDAHRAANRDPATLNALRAGFLGRMTRGEFTPGEEIYP